MNAALPSEPATPGAALLVSPVRRGIVEALDQPDPERREQGLSAADLGELLGLHVTTIRFHTDQLVAVGLLEAYFVRDGGVGRPGKRYRLREHPLGEAAATGEGPFEVLAGLLTGALSVQESSLLTPEEAGRRWVAERVARAEGQGAAAPEVGGAAATLVDRGAVSPEDRRGAVDRLAVLLRDWGYRPDSAEHQDDGTVSVTLHDCPFHSLARSHPDVVCGVHRGLLRGALEAVGEAGAGVSLRPFTGPRTCQAVLTLGAGTADAGEGVTDPTGETVGDPSGETVTEPTDPTASQPSTEDT